MQEIRSSNPPVITGICDPNKSRARHHCSLYYNDLKMSLIRKLADKREKMTNEESAKLASSKQGKEIFWVKIANQNQRNNSKDRNKFFHDKNRRKLFDEQLFYAANNTQVISLFY